MPFRTMVVCAHSPALAVLIRRFFRTGKPVTTWLRVGEHGLRGIRTCTAPAAWLRAPYGGSECFASMTELPWVVAYDAEAKCLIHCCNGEFGLSLRLLIVDFILSTSLYRLFISIYPDAKGQEFIEPPIRNH